MTADLYLMLLTIALSTSRRRRRRLCFYVYVVWIQSLPFAVALQKLDANPTTRDGKSCNNASPRDSASSAATNQTLFPCHVEYNPGFGPLVCCGIVMALSFLAGLYTCLQRPNVNVVRDGDTVATADDEADDASFKHEGDETIASCPAQNV